MRVQDITIGETYRHRDNPNYGYAKALKIIRPVAKFKRKHAFDLMEDEKNAKVVCVKCEWTIGKYDTFGMVKYFRPCDLVKEQTK